MTVEKQTSQSDSAPIKLALSVHKNFDPHNVTIDELIKLEPFLANRAECEVDTTAVQLIPYITLVDTTGPTLKYFVYTRGKASGEQRLTGKCSVGLGGHVEEIIKPDSFSNKIVNSVCMAAVRELQEEIGLEIPFYIFANAMVKDYAISSIASTNKLYNENAKILYNTTTPTDVVHLGISFILKATPSDISSLEFDVITRGRWMSYKEIKEAQTSDDPIDLEVWSKTVVALINLYELNILK